jgi:hypothetical protein
MPDIAIVAACDPQLDRARAAAQRTYAEPVNHRGRPSREVFRAKA